MENQVSLIKMFDVFPDHINHLFPIVFQCSVCKAILGDSLSWEISNEAMQVICLSQASEFVITDEEILIQRSGSNQISTYSKLSCKGCRQIIGKFFHSTCHDFDQFRGLFTFHVSQISIYQTGREGNYRDIVSRPEYTDPIKCILISLNERLSLIEKKLGISRGNGNSDGDDNSGCAGNMNDLSENASRPSADNISSSKTSLTNSSSHVQTDSAELHGNLSSSDGDTSGFSDTSNR